MDLIDRYIEEVGRFLPRKIRSDVQRELRSTLEDSLENRSSNAGDNDAETVQVALLQELGHPEELAASYLPEPRYLVGPRLYPGLLLTMKICLVALAALLLLGVVTLAGDEGGSQRGIFAVAIALFDDFVATAVTVFGIVVLVFALIERLSGPPKSTTREWDPRTLPEIDDHDRVSRVGQGVKLALMSLALVAVNFNPDGIGSFVIIGEQSGWVPLLGTAFYQQLWLLNLALGLDLLLNLVVWRRGRWQLATRWLGLGTTFIWVFFLYQLATGPSIVEPDAEWMIAHGWSREAAAGYVELVQEALSDLIGISLRIGLIAALVGAAVQLFGLLNRTVRQVLG